MPGLQVFRLVRYQLSRLAQGGGASPPAAGGLALAPAASEDEPSAAAAGADAGGGLVSQRELEELLAGGLLPSLACVPVQLPLAAEAWACMRTLPAATRFRIYADLRVGRGERG
jgi:hypothetical protein